MWTFRRAIPSGCSILAPQAPFPDPFGGFSWWHVRDGFTRSQLIDDARPAAETLSSFVRGAVSHYDLRPAKIIAFGFSQGGGVLSYLIQSEPELLSGIAILAGFVVETDLPPSAKQTTKVFWAHGTLDDRVKVESAHRGSEYLRSRGIHVDYVEERVGHKVGSSALKALAAWSAEIQGGR